MHIKINFVCEMAAILSWGVNWAISIMTLPSFTELICIQKCIFDSDTVRCQRCCRRRMDLEDKWYLDFCVSPRCRLMVTSTCVIISPTVISTAIEHFGQTLYDAKWWCIEHNPDNLLPTATKWKNNGPEWAHHFDNHWGDWPCTLTN